MIHFYTPLAGKRAGTETLSLKSKELNCSILYMIKSGHASTQPSYPSSFCCGSPPTAVHAVFEWERHGTTYAMISQEQVKHLAKLQGSNFLKSWMDLWVPHIVEPPSKQLVSRAVNRNLRATLRIPENSMVFCRHGGSDSFDIKFVHDVVCASAHKYNMRTNAPDHRAVHFLFLGTNEWGNCTSDVVVKKKHPLITFLPTTVEPLEKEVGSVVSLPVK